MFVLIKLLFTFWFGHIGDHSAVTYDAQIAVDDSWAVFLLS